jgi:Stress-induced bacterial acidophilic repeat motif
MEVTIIKEDQLDRILMVRSDGSRAETTFAKKGPFPHDAVHYAVEKHLGLADGFWGFVASGRDPEEVAAIAKQGGHASAKRAQVPHASIIELLQAERIVECFEADLWGGPASPEMLCETAKVACESSFVPALALTDDEIAAIRNELKQMQAQWVSGSIRFCWND